MATTYLSYTQGAPTNNKKWTWSAWLKLGKTIGARYIMSSYVDANNATSIRILDSTSSSRLDFQNYVSSSDAGRLKTTRYLRDPTAWYHVVCVFDSDNVTSGDRQQIWINGVRQTAFDTETYPSSGAASIINADTRVAELGRRSDNADMYDGLMSHVHFCDGQAYSASDFGSFDATSGIWVPNNSPSVSYGNNGYFMKFASGATGTDSSGESNDMTVSGTMTSPKDNPQNNYCLMNPLDTFYPSATFTNCNTTIATDNATWTTATQWLQSGLWYWEVQPTGTLGGGECMGILDRVSQGTTENVYSGSGLYGAVVRSGGNVYLNSVDSGNISPSGDLWATGDVIGIYIDLNANKIYFAKNGTILNSGTGKALTDPLSTLNFAYTPIWGSSNSSASTANFNFGTGYLGTTALTGTTYTDSNSEGKFKYSPNNSGGSSFDGSAKNFLAICTNNIATGS